MVKREVLFNAPIEKVYEVIRDFESYPEFIPSTKSAHEEQGRDGPEVDFSLQVIKPIRYRLKFHCEEPNLIEWTLVKGELMKKNSGAWRLKSTGAHTTHADYEIDIEFGWMVPKMIVEELTRIQLPELFMAFKNRAEK